MDGSAEIASVEPKLKGKVRLADDFEFENPSNVPAAWREAYAHVGGGPVEAFIGMERPVVIVVGFCHPLYLMERKAQNQLTSRVDEKWYLGLTMPSRPSQ